MKFNRTAAMRATTLALALTLGAGTAALAGGKHAHDHAHDHSPKHGGVVVEVRDMDLELVAQPMVMRLYLRGHGKAVDLAQARAKLILQSGSDKQEIELKPAGDRLEASGSFKLAPGSKAVAVVTLAGKPMTARFALGATK